MGTGVRKKQVVLSAGEGGQAGDTDTGWSFNHLPTHGLFRTSTAGWAMWEPGLVLAKSMVYASFLTPSSLPPPQKMTGKKKLDHLGLWEGLAERRYLTVTVLGSFTSSPHIQVLTEIIQTRAIYGREHKIERMCFWEFWQKSAFWRR